MKETTIFRAFLFFVFFPLFGISGFVSCTSQAVRTAQAEEYFSIGMAYYELGKFNEAEVWFNRARASDKTMVASDYNLGRIAFETRRYADAAKYFESVLALDNENVMALKAAAYSRIKNGDLEKAEALYDQVLTLVPESADDGFNYALVLYGLEKYEDCEEVLSRYPFSLEEKPSSILLFARAQKAQNKVEAVDSYAKWLIIHTGAVNPQGLYEYGQVLEEAGLYARAIEQYRDAIKALTKDTEDLKKANLMFEEARLLLTADPENEEGLTAFRNAVDEGFSNTETFEELLLDSRISNDRKTELRKIFDSREKEEEEEEEETDVTDGVL
jgi:tetratricopeptide (TPR) repeat protein